MQAQVQSLPRAGDRKHNKTAHILPFSGTSFKAVEDNKVRHDYQEIKIQESTQVLDVGAIPRSIPIILMDDLVDIVKAGDDAIVTGILTAKWSSDLRDVRCNLDPVLIANHRLFGAAWIPWIRFRGGLHNGSLSQENQ